MFYSNREFMQGNARKYDTSQLCVTGQFSPANHWITLGATKVFIIIANVAQNSQMIELSENSSDSAEIVQVMQIAQSNNFCCSAATDVNVDKIAFQLKVDHPVMCV